MNGLVLDLYLQFVTTSVDLQKLLADRLRFPDYYGHNWDAFADCVTEADQWLPTRIRIHGWEAMENRLPRDARLMRQAFVRLVAERRDCSIEWVAD